ncbi:hypothetical protein [Ktedonosporobacter rubrisoli]|uniref:hypothetical protein n=1 Tax=Ktedonosporobacter rubrisoli TaxID=2509675 RepID=UPI001F5D108D|nr:hypothetical protein [Ktedonosporobacter rubrisoli]
MTFLFKLPLKHHFERACFFRQQKPYALIDFDTAGLAPRIWDVACAAYRFIPLSNHPKLQSFGLEQPSMQYERLVLFCVAYGSLFSPEEVIEAAIRRIEAMCSLIIKHAVTELAFQHMIDAGDLDIYYQDIGQMLQTQQKMIFFH